MCRLGGTLGYSVGQTGALSRSAGPAKPTPRSGAGARPMKLSATASRCPGPDHRRSFRNHPASGSGWSLDQALANLLIRQVGCPEMTRKHAALAGMAL